MGVVGPAMSGHHAGLPSIHARPGQGVAGVPEACVGMEGGEPDMRVPSLWRLYWIVVTLPGRIEGVDGPGQDGLMPESFEYVVAAYGIWSLVFLLYVPLIKRKIRTLQQNIEALRNEDSTNTN